MAIVTPASSLYPGPGLFPGEGVPSTPIITPSMLLYPGGTIFPGMELSYGLAEYGSVAVGTHKAPDVSIHVR